MSKQQNAKQKQGYMTKAPQRMCSNCAHFRSEFETVGVHGYQKEINIRCGLGGFAVKKQGVCDEWEVIL